MDNELYIFNGRYWEIIKEMEVNSWSCTVVKHPPDTSECREIYNRLLRQKVKRREDMPLVLRGI